MSVLDKINGDLKKLADVLAAVIQEDDVVFRKTETGIYQAFQHKIKEKHPEDFDKLTLDQVKDAVEYLALNKRASIQPVRIRHNQLLQLIPGKSSAKHKKYPSRIPTKQPRR